MAVEVACAPDRHVWPLPDDVQGWPEGGVTCYCGATAMVLVACNCGHEHIHKVPRDG